jgi:hypothetical protein
VFCKTSLFTTFSQELKRLLKKEHLMGAGVAPTMKDFCDEEPARSALLIFFRGDSTLATRATGATRRDLATLSSSSLSRVRSTTANASVEVLFAMFAVQMLEKGTNTLNVRFVRHQTC